MQNQCKWRKAELSDMHDAVTFTLIDPRFHRMPVDVKLAGVSAWSMEEDKKRAERALAAVRELMDGREIWVDNNDGKDKDIVNVYIKVEEDELWHEAVYKFDEDGVVLPWLHVNEWLLVEGYAHKKD